MAQRLGPGKGPSGGSEHRPLCRQRTPAAERLPAAAPSSRTGLWDCAPTNAVHAESWSILSGWLVAVYWRIICRPIIGKVLSKISNVSPQLSSITPSSLRPVLTGEISRAGWKMRAIFTAVVPWTRMVRLSFQTKLEAIFVQSKFETQNEHVLISMNATSTC